MPNYCVLVAMVADYRFVISDELALVLVTRSAMTAQ